MCGRCAMVCENNCHEFMDGIHSFKRNKCTACKKCTVECVTEALEAAGKESTVDDVIQEVLKDKIFYENSCGGMTVSGGEPMLKFEFTYGLFKAAKKEGLHTCIETCGFAKPEQYEKIKDFVDIFMFDYKATDPKKHKEYTGVDNELILSNLRMLDDSGSKIVLRCPIIPSLNDTEEHFCGIAVVANSLKNILEINIEPYHPLGKGKAEMLGKEYKLSQLTFPEEATVEEWIKTISEKTNVTVKKV